MLSYFQRPKFYLLLANIILVFFAIILTNVGILPFRNLGDFGFFVALGLALALYRPGWAFLFFIGTIALENINLAPISFPIDMRPYQFFGALTIIALIVRYFSKRLNFKLVKPKWFDYLIIIFAASSFVSAIVSANKGASLKQSLVLLSFAFLYFLVRNFIQDLSDLKKVIPFFFSSSVVVAFYGIWQNIQFLHGLNSFETMPGRPNATFTEADWLGIFITFSIAVIYAVILYIDRLQNEENFEIYNLQFTIFNQFSISKFTFIKLFSYLFLCACYILLILTVARSAWLGAAIITFIYLLLVLVQKINPKYWQWKSFGKNLFFIGVSGLLSVGIIYIFHLTNFQLFNRAQSSTSGFQEITISCLSKTDFDKVPQKINNVSELVNYNCRHINLEEILTEKEKGNYVGEVLRADPNVSIRSDIFRKSLEQIEAHPILGIGWGRIGKILGTDSRGMVLNSSNIFLEVWLGSGIIGLLAFLAILVYILFKSIRGLFSDDFNNKIISTFTILGFFALIIPDLFNAGIFLGILWLFLGVSQIKK